MQGYFEGYWNLETQHKPIRFGEKDTKARLLDLAVRMLDVLYRSREPGTEVVAVEQETGEILDRNLVRALDLVERDAEGRLIVVDIKSAQVLGSAGAGVAAALGLQLRDGDEWAG